MVARSRALTDRADAILDQINLSAERPLPEGAVLWRTARAGIRDHHRRRRANQIVQVDYSGAAPEDH